jgi:hypothetical protein
MWFRALTIAAVLVAWLVVRKRARLSIAHPWLLALVVGGAASLLSDLSNLRRDVGAHALYALAALLGLSGLFLLGEGLRQELRLPHSGRRTAVVVALCVVTSAFCGFLPTPRNRIVADVVGASFLIMLLEPLIVAPQRVAPWLLGTGIVAYAAGRTVLTIEQFRGVHVLALEHLLDSGAFAVLGAGIVAFVVEGKLRKLPRVSASDSPGNRDTSAVA